VRCRVHGCESDGFKLHELKKRQELFELPSEVIVCELHRGELSEPNTEWVMVNRSDGSRDLYVGASLRQLSEYIMLERSMGRSAAQRRRLENPAGSGCPKSHKTRPQQRPVMVA
jgi:hypothetical protein